MNSGPETPSPSDTATATPGAEEGATKPADPKLEALRQEVINSLKVVHDPEIPVNIVDLGLIYDVIVDGPACNIRMTLTSQSCPEAKTIPDVMKRRVKAMEGIDSCEIEIVWEPQWTPQLISAEGRKILQIDEE